MKCCVAYVSRSDMEVTVVGAGLFGATVARLLTDKGHCVRLVEERPVVGGMAYDELHRGIRVHTHGAHIFHTKSEEVWRFVNRFGKFNNYVHTVWCSLNGQYISFPPNLMTYQQLGSNDRQVIHDKLLDGYSKKQWGGITPDWAISRIPFRTTFDNNYFSGEHQGIPVNGYTSLVQAMIAGIPLEHRKFTLADVGATERVIYSGAIDELFDYRFGKLGYRSLRFDVQELRGDYQGCAVVNYPSPDIPYTRSIEHKHFLYQKSAVTVVSFEHPCSFDGTNERYYPILTPENQCLYCKYMGLLPSNVTVGGRLGNYSYCDMTQCIEQAFTLCKTYEDQSGADGLRQVAGAE